MSRHRLLRKSLVDDDDDGDDDYNYDDYGSSPISPSASQYMFKRDGSGGGKNQQLAAFLERHTPPASGGKRDTTRLDAAMAQIVDIMGDDFGGHEEQHVQSVRCFFGCAIALGAARSSPRLHFRVAQVLQRLDYDVGATVTELTNKAPSLRR